MRKLKLQDTPEMHAAITMIYDLMRTFEETDQQLGLASTTLLAVSQTLTETEFNEYLDSLKILRASNIERIRSELEQH